MARTGIAHRLVLIIAALVLLAACGPVSSGDKPSADRDAADVDQASVDDELSASEEAFARATSVHVRYAIHADGQEVAAEGEAAYRSGETVYAAIRYLDAGLASDDVRETLLLPPDLYLQRADGSWLVQSPWNQGMRPGEEGAGLNEPIISYAELVGNLDDPERLTDETVEGRELARYKGTVDLDDMSAFKSDDESSAPRAAAELWIDGATELPVKVELRVRGLDAGRITVEFLEYDQAIVLPPAPADAQPLRDAQLPDAPCTGDALAGCLEAQGGIAGNATCGGAGRRICLAPLGHVPPALVEHLVAHYREQYGLDVTVLTPSAIPSSLEDPLRQQVDAAALIDYVGGLFPEARSDAEAVVIGLTSIDLYDSTSHFRYVFGLKGTADDPKGVVSTFRMDPLTYSEPADDGVLYTRARKMVSRYVGVLYYGLPTNGDPQSLMYDSILGVDDLDTMQEPLAVDGSR